ncbi:MAG: hypothetical protein R3F11_25005 [Verrucomicrobiales bacterium]
MKPKLFLLSCLALGAGVSFAAKPADGPVEIKSGLQRSGKGMLGVK